MNRSWSKTHPFRAPDWRWRRANYYWSKSFKRKRKPADGEVIGLEEPEQPMQIPRIPRCADNDEEVLRILRFLLNRRTKTPNPVFQQDAFEIHHNDAFCLLRWELEARILSGASVSELAKRMGMLEQTVQCYENWFYDVRDKLDNKSYVFQCLIAPKLPSTEENVVTKEGIWKLYAFIGNEQLLDQVIFESVQAPLDEGFWAEDLVHNIYRKLAIACRANVLKPVELLRAFSHLYKIKKQAQTPFTKSEIQRHLYEALTSIQWDWTDEATKKDDEIYMIGGASLKPEELLLLGSDKPGPEFTKYLQSAQFPK